MALARLIDGEVSTEPSRVELNTHRDRILIKLEGPQSLNIRMMLRGHEGAHVCDGSRFLEPVQVSGSACGCPPTWGQRRAASRGGQGPKPEITVRFRLVEALGIGCFDLVSSSWALIEDIEAARASLSASDWPAKACLSIDRSVFTTAEGVEVIIRRPKMRLLNPISRFLISV
ncbi:hypothetical protein ACFVVA_10660 [Kitasatospora sp. NPDC058048]|uniref:hypothetical protein n=1 Tax=Kitasatospora sp. NPDC058048 TaxID=3346313 RepID=UPI0036D9156A